MLKDSYTKHVYDVDLIAIYESIDIEFNKHSLPPDRMQEFKESLIFAFKEYCKFKNIDFDLHFKERTYIVVPSTEHFYEYAIQMMLLFYEIPRINLFLNYQKDNYKGENDFVGLIEFLVYENIRLQTLFNNEVRLERIMQWVETNRTQKNKVKSILGSEIKQESLVWNADNIDLINLSARLKLNGYIQNKNEFVKVFTEQKPILWLKQPEFLAHLLYSLYESQLFKTSKGKGYFAIAEHYFSRYSENSDKKLTLKDMSSRVNKEDIKYSKIRKEVKGIIAESIKAI